jgi:hypothetical protein
VWERPVTTWIVGKLFITWKEIISAMSRQAWCYSRASERVRDISGAVSLRLIFLFIASILVTLFVVQGNATAERLFQSPQSPPAAPEVQPAFEEPLAPVEEVPFEQPPVEQALPEQPPIEQVPLDQAPAEQFPLDQPAIEQVPAEAPAPESPPFEDPLAPAAQPEEQPLQEPEASTGSSRRERSRNLDQNEQTGEERGSHNFVLDRAEFIDTVVVSGAYVWACCGISLLLLVPLFLLILEIRGRSKIRRQE